MTNNQARGITKEVRETNVIILVPVTGTEEEKQRIAMEADHVEVWPSDPDRVRLRFKDGSAGQWYSRLWPSVKASWLLKRA